MVNRVLLNNFYLKFYKKDETSFTDITVFSLKVYTYRNKTRDIRQGELINESCHSYVTELSNLNMSWNYGYKEDRSKIVGTSLGQSLYRFNKNHQKKRYV